MSQFRGVMPAIITPMAADGSVDEALYRQVMERNIELGVHGFWVAGGTGESVHLDDSENMRIAEIAADQASGRITNILHVGTPSTRRSVKLAEHAAKVGIDAICCVPPMFYPPTEKEIVTHYAAVAAAADLPFFVYNLPQCTGVEITVELMNRIQDSVPQLTGLKHSALTVAGWQQYADVASTQHRRQRLYRRSAECSTGALVRHLECMGEKRSAGRSGCSKQSVRTDHVNSRVRFAGWL